MDAPRSSELAPVLLSSFFVGRRGFGIGGSVFPDDVVSAMMASPKHVLNRLKWEASDASLEDVLVYYRHRGAPDDTAALRGADILEIGRSFLELPEGVRLPHHRILRIERAGRVMWSRAKEQPGSPAKKP